MITAGKGGAVQNKKRADYVTGHDLRDGSIEARAFNHSRDMIAEHFRISSSAFFSSMTSLTSFLQLFMVA